VQPAQSTAYGIDPSSNRLSSVTPQGQSTQARTYDAAGNTTRFVPTLGSNAGSTLDSSYSGRNRLVQHKLGSSTTTRYAYNAFGERVAKWVGAEAVAQASAPAGTVTAPTRQYAYDERGHLIGEYDGQGGRSRKRFGWKMPRW